ncbi:Amino acid--[acyl-carrier-protein] ligase 2 [compost metagenome]
MMSNAKYELLVTTSNHKEVSIASFNYCADTLCSKYEITDAADALLQSGCVAFGMDRWKEAYIDVHGRSLANWPDNKVEKELIV